MRRSASLIIGVVFCLAGCGDGLKLADVKGVLILDGKPISGVAVTFSPISPGQSPSSSMTDEKGNFHLAYSRSRSGAMIGEHRVILENVAGETAAGEPFKVPRHYRKAGGELTATVEPGKNFIELNLTSDEKSGKM